MQGLVELAVAGAVEPHPYGLAGGGGDGCGAAEHGEGGVGWVATRMGPGTEHDGGHHRAHPAAGEQVWPPGADQGGDGPGVLGDLAVEELDAAGQGPQAGRGGGGLRIQVSPQPEPTASADQAGCGPARQPATKRVRSGDDEGVELALGVGGGLDRGAARGQPHLKRCMLAGSPGLGKLGTAQSLPGGPGGV